MTTLNDIEFELAKLELKSGDLLVIKSKVLLNAKQLEEIRKIAQRHVPEGVKAMVVIDDYATLKVKKAS